jgi:hypothetical protein
VSKTGLEMNLLLLLPTYRVRELQKALQVRSPIPSTTALRTHKKSERDLLLGLCTFT